MHPGNYESENHFPSNWVNKLTDLKSKSEHWGGFGQSSLDETLSSAPRPLKQAAPCLTSDVSSNNTLSHQLSTLGSDVC